jgi:hypothetical protein
VFALVDELSVDEACSHLNSSRGVQTNLSQSRDWRPWHTTRVDCLSAKAMLPFDADVEPDANRQCDPTHTLRPQQRSLSISVPSNTPNVKSHYCIDHTMSERSDSECALFVTGSILPAPRRRTPPSRSTERVVRRQRHSDRDVVHLYHRPTQQQRPRNGRHMPNSSKKVSSTRISLPPFQPGTRRKHAQAHLHDHSLCQAQSWRQHRFVRWSGSLEISSIAIQAPCSPLSSTVSTSQVRKLQDELVTHLLHRHSRLETSSCQDTTADQIVRVVDWMTDLLSLAACDRLQELIQFYERLKPENESGALYRAVRSGPLPHDLELCGLALACLSAATESSAQMTAQNLALQQFSHHFKAVISLWKAGHPAWCAILELIAFDARLTCLEAHEILLLHISYTVNKDCEDLRTAVLRPSGVVAAAVERFGRGLLTILPHNTLEMYVHVSELDRLH